MKVDMRVNDREAQGHSAHGDMGDCIVLDVNYDTCLLHILYVVQ